MSTLLNRSSIAESPLGHIQRIEPVEDRHDLQEVHAHAGMPGTIVRSGFNNVRMNGECKDYLRSIKTTVLNTHIVGPKMIDPVFLHHVPS